MEAWLPAHFAKVDNRIALAIKSVLDQILPVDSSRIRETENYAFRRANKESKEAPRVPRSASGSGAGEPPQAGAVGSGDAASNAVKYFLATTQVAAIQAEMTQQEEKLALQATKKLQAQSEYKKLLEKVLGLREEIADLEAGGAGADVIRARKDDLNRTIVTGRTLERQMFEQVKATARAGDVAKKYQNTAAKTVDTQIELERSSKKAFSGEIRAQMQAQVNAAKDVERQTKNLVNTWVTGRYALYDVGNAYAEVSRQLWMASRQIFNITQAYRSYETAFTSVERAIEPLAATLSGSKDEAASLQEAFINLSEEIPVSFEEIAKIATLGAQMGVTASGIVDFTKVVSEFSSVTGVSADTVAQKFGRIAELANVDYSQFANLGSSILYAGINAVATEPEIMTLSESIAAVSAQAGMVPSEIVGMATALASTGIQAEQARGVFTRVFADIDRAVSRGGTGLDNFAAMAGMSAENFAKAWGTEGASYDVFRAILGGLGATEDLTSAFDSLNIVETREINTLTRLAENLNVVDQAISDANSSFESGAFLAESFQKTVDNLDSKIAMFNNNVKALTVELSKSLAGGLSFVLEIANKMLQVFKEMAKNETFAGFAFGGLAVTALGAAATLAVSAMAKLIAQVYAFRVAAINTANDSTAMSGMKDMFKQLTGWGGGLIEMRDQLKSVSPDVRGVITPVTGRMADHLGDSFATLGNKVGLFGDELKSTDRVKRSLLKTDNIYLANTRQESDLITQLIAQRADEIQSIEMRTGSIMHSYQATVAEQSAINKGEATIESINAARAKERALLLDAIGGKQLHVTTVNGETVAYTKNQIATDNATLSSKLATQQEKAEAAARLKNKTALDLQTRSASKASKMSLGPGAIVMGAATAAGGILAVVTTIMTVVTAVQAAIEATKVDLLESGGGLASLRDAIKQDTIEYQKLTEEQKRTSDNYSLINVKTRTYATETNKSAEAIREATGASQSFVDANQKVKEGVESTTFALGEQTRAWIANAMMQDENLLSAIEKYPELLNSLEGYGVSFGEILNQVMQNPDADPIANLRKEVAVLDQEIRRRLTPNVFDEANNKALDAAKAQRTQLEMTIQTVDSLRGALSSATSTSEIFEAIRAALGLDSALEETTETANGLSDALRTVLDYASDLNGMLSRVVELEFGKQMSRDNITSGWRDLTKSVNDSKEAIEEANKEIKGLTADRDVLQYQLSVAERYGDEVRAAKIRAELAKVNKQVTDSEKKLAEAQADSSTALTGDSDAAIKNRSELLKMVGVYQSHIEMLAKLGMNRGELEESADALKRQFLAEAKALGFSGKQLEDYAGLFDNFADTAANAPRDVDIEVKLGLTAAEQAITEFTSKNRSTNVGVKVDTKDADKKGSDLDIFLNKNREVKARLEKIETLAADGSLKSWLKLEREFGAPKVTNITADAADTKIRNWLTKERSMAPAIMSVPHFLSADNAINVWLKRGREMQVDVVASMKSSSLASAQATAAFDLARILPPGTHRDSYNEMGRMLNKVAGDLRGRGMAAGGLVTGPGSGTSDSIPTMLSNGEYVVKANAVKTYGVDFFNALNQQRMGFAPVSGGRFNGQQQQGPTIVFLSPEDRQLLRQFGDRPVNLYADSTKIAEVANSGNTKMSRRGTR
jgi:TP901 family phage tail tape measure protein